MIEPVLTLTKPILFECMLAPVLSLQTSEVHLEL